MSVLVNFAIFPTDKGDSVSEFVSQVIKMISESGFAYKLNSMGTVVETNTMDEALDIISKSYKVLEPFSKRVYCTATFDIQKAKDNRLSGKIASIENRIGEVKK